jgi:alanine-glyoxylate transaminase/serine-glyoxylate transaminase/serine-pyruvate transaminase
MAFSHTEQPAASEFVVPERLLLGPGPSNADPRVLRTMSAPLVGHLDPFFLELMDNIQELLRQVFQTQNPLTLPVSGTGTAAMEAAVANLVEPGDTVLVAINGYFSQRIAEMARRYGGVVHTISRPWGEIFTPDELRQALAEHPSKVVAMVHAETSTGALQPLEEVTRVVHDQGGLLLVDAVTSLGGLPVRVDEVGLDACYSGAQKCLSCPPGLSPVTFGPAAVKALEQRRVPVTSFYLDLTLLKKYWGVERAYHHTAPITTAYGLYEALYLVAEEGLQARWERHQRNAQRLWQGLEGLGMEMHVPLEHRLPTLTTVCIPAGINDGAVRQRLLKEFNIEIGGGLGELKGKVWRIGLMGYNSRPEVVDRLLTALQAVLQ